MKIPITRLQIFLILLVVVLSGAALPFISRAARQTHDDLEPTQQAQKRPSSIPGEILVRFRSDAAAVQRPSSEMAVREGGREIKLQIEAFTAPEIVPDLRLARVSPADTSSAIAALAARADVLYAEPNFLRYKDQVPNDPRYSEQYALKNTGQTVGVAGADIKAEPAWDITTGSRSVVVGVVDEGIDINHLDLRDNIWKNSAEVANNGIDDDANGFIDDINGWDFVHDDNTVFDGNGTFPNDPTDAHGTHVAGTIGATGNNALGVVGVNWQVSIMSLKFLGPVSGSSADLLKALSYAKMMRDLFVSSGGTRGANLKVLNNSYGGVGFSQAELEAVKALNDSGVLFVAAAGNDAQDNFTYPHYPANYDSANVISVASTTNQDGLSSFSDFGARVVTMGAPGSSILSTTPNNTYSFASGTSMASPHVAGAAALVVAAKPDISLPKLAATISYGGDLKLQTTTRTGRRLNVFKSIQTALEGDVLTPSTPAGFNVTSLGARAFSAAWAAPGDDGSTGTAADYDFFFTGSEVNAVPLLMSSQVFPAIPGTQQSFTVTIPYRHATGTIILRSYDNAGNFSDATAVVNLPVSVSTDPFMMGSGPAGGLSTGGTRLLNSDNSVFQGDDRYRSNYTLPFGFPYFGVTRTQLTVSSNGALYFTAPPVFPNGAAADYSSSIESLRGKMMIAPLWDDLVLNTSLRPNDGVYILRPDPNGIIFRWQCATHDGSLPVNFEIELRSDGSVAFRYGDGNSSLLPVVGLAGADADPYVVAAYTSKSIPVNLNNAQAVAFIPFGGMPFPSPTPSPSPTPTPSPSPTPIPSPGPGGVRQISLATKDLVYEPYSQRIYASVPSSAGANGNSLTRIDPFTGTVGPSILMGNEPGKLAISNNAQYIYASLDGIGAVRRFDVAAQTAGLQFPVGVDGFSGLVYALDLAVVPGQPDSIAVSRKYQSSGDAGIAVYDNGFARSVVTPNSTGAPEIEFSSSATTLYGYNNQSTEFGFRKMSVSDSGVIVTSVTTNLISGFDADILYDSGRIFSTNGRVIDPELGIQIGSCAGLGFSSLVQTDVPANRIYYLDGAGSSTLTLKAFNLTTFVQTGSLTISGVSGNPRSLIKWGADGLAFRTTGNQVFLISTTAIVPLNPTPTPSPVQSAPGVIKLPLNTNDLIYDGNTQTVFASLPSTAGTFGNSIAPINPQTGLMGSAVFLGSEPRKLAISANGKFIYAGLDGEASVRRFDVPSQTAELRFSLGQSQSNGPMYVEDMTVVPNSPNSVAISRRNSGFSPKHEGVGIYDDGIIRGTTTPRHTGSNVIEYSSSSATLYGYNNETSEFGLRKMTVNASGVSTVATYPSVMSGFGADIHYDNGLLYSTTGRVLNPETGEVVGSFPDASGPVVADSSTGRVYYLTGSSSTITLKEYDANTLSQTGSLTITGVNSPAGSLIKCGPNLLAFRADNQVFFVLKSAITPLPPTPLPTPLQLASGVISLPLATNDLVYEPSTGWVYASVPGAAGTFGNSITPLNPRTGTIGSPVFIGSDPRKLALSGDGQYIYVGLDGSGSVRRFTTASQTAGLQFSLGTAPTNGTLYVEDMSVMPGNPNTVAISRRNKVTTAHHEGVGIYDNGVLRSITTSKLNLVNAIEFSASAATLYGYNQESSEFGFRKLAVNSSGVSIVQTTIGLMGGYGADILYHNGRIYSTGGDVINPDAGTLLGRFSNGFGPVVADANVGRVYFISGNDSSTQLRVFDLNTFASIGSFNIPGVTGSPGSLLRWGSGGLAFRTSGNQVFFLQTSQLPAPIANPIDDARSFVRRHYLDFLNREPDQGGWDFWTNKITQCTTDALCVDSERIGVSAAFFVELEFQQTGYVVYRLYRSAYGTQANAPTRASITFQQFIGDRAQLVGGPGLPQSTINFANNFAERPEFKAMYPADGSMTNAQFVNKLFDTASLAPYTAERQQQIDAMNNNAKTRAQVLLDLIEINEFKTREYNPAFVLMQYYGYLRRNPDQNGYDFWLNVLNGQPNNFRGMVCSFLTSTEYQQRFGTSITRSNQDCSQ